LPVEAIGVEPGGTTYIARGSRLTRAVFTVSTTTIAHGLGRAAFGECHHRQGKISGQTPEFMS
jgi:hypothetical protein